MSILNALVSFSEVAAICIHVHYLFIKMSLSCLSSSLTGKPNGACSGVPRVT